MRAPALSVAACIALALSCAAPAHAAQQEAAFTWASRYDMAGRLVGKIAPDPDLTGPLRLLAERYTYSNGLLVSVESGQLTSWPDETVAPAQWAGYGFSGGNIFSTVEYAYDGYGRKTTASLRGKDGVIASLVQYGYNAQNLVECRTVRMNPATYGSPQPSACSVGTAGQDGPDRITRFTYDGLDQVLTEQRAYDTDLQQTAVINTYIGRQLRSQTDANFNRTELEYDSFGRLFRRYYPSPTRRGQVNLSDYSEYTYEVNGNLRTERKRSGAIITYGYDQNNRVIDKTLSDRTHSDDVHYDYDLRGLMRAAHFAASPAIGAFNEFDGFGRLDAATSSVRADTAAILSRTLTYGYDADGNRTRVIHPDDVRFEYTYDGLNRVDGVLENGTATLLSVTYNVEGKRSGLLRPSGANTLYDFDDAGRLEWFEQQFDGTANDLTNTFRYNPARQVTQLTRSNNLYSYSGSAGVVGNYAPNGLNQYAIVAGQRIAYDANGNLTSDGTLTYTYDMENRLVGTGGVAAGLRYDPLGRLVEIAVIPGTTTHFLYDGDVLVAEYTVSGGNETRTRRYVHGNGTNEPWVQYNGSAVGPAYRRHLHLDHQGSVIAQSGETAAVLTRNSYDAFGTPGSNNSGRFGYTGQLWLSELDLNYYRARMYSPRLGRFLQTDPIGYADDFNLYAYVGNDPVNRTDPLGLRNCPLGDTDCYETEESAQQPGDPAEETPAESTLEEVVVSAAKDKKVGDQKINFVGENEDFFTVRPDGSTTKREMKTTVVKCGGKKGDFVVGQPGALAPGESALHSHGSDLGPYPGRRDDIAARNSTTGVAGVVTSNGRGFIVKMNSTNGTFSARQVEGDPLSSAEADTLRGYMGVWENPPPSTGSLKDIVCK